MSPWIASSSAFSALAPPNCSTYEVRVLRLDRGHGGEGRRRLLAVASSSRPAMLERRPAPRGRPRRSPLVAVERRAARSSTYVERRETRRSTSSTAARNAGSSTVSVVALHEDELLDRPPPGVDRAPARRRRGLADVLVVVDDQRRCRRTLPTTKARDDEPRKPKIAFLRCVALQRPIRAARLCDAHAGRRRLVGRAGTVRLGLVLDDAGSHRAPPSDYGTSPSLAPGAARSRKPGDWPVRGAVFWRLDARCANAQGAGTAARRAPARLAPGRGQAELAEDAGDVLLDRAQRDHQRVGDALVGAARSPSAPAPRARAASARRAGRRCAAATAAWRR